MRFGNVNDGHLTHLRGRTNHTRQVACKAGEAEVTHVGRLERRARKQRELPADIATRAVVKDDRVRTVVLFNPIHLLDNLVVGLVPGDALPFVFTSLAGAPHRVLQAIGMVDCLDHIEAAHAELTSVERGERVALDMHELAVLVDRQKNAAAIVASRRRPVVGSRDSKIALLPTPLALMVGFAVNRLEELLVIHFSSLSPSPLLR